MKKSILGLIACVVMLMVTISCTVVDNSEVGFRFKRFGLTDQGELKASPVTGYVFFNPVTTCVYTYPVYVQRIEYDVFDVNTKDAAQFFMKPVLAYQLDRAEAVSVFTKYRLTLKQIEQGYMKTCIQTAYRNVANNYSSDEIMSNRAKFETEVRNMLGKSLGSEGFIVQEFTSQITPPESLRQMIDAKNTAIQSALKAENEVKEAEANAKIAIAKAQGDADAMKIKADAEAYYNKTISESLSGLIVQEDWIEKWDGKLPTYAAGGNGSAVPFMNIGK